MPDRHARPLARRAERGGEIVGRAVVDDDDLGVEAGKGRGDLVQQAGHVGRLVLARDNDADPLVDETLHAGILAAFAHRTYSLPTGWTGPAFFSLAMSQRLRM